MRAEVPVIDLQRRDAAIAPEIARACADWGFFQVINHSIPAASVQTVLQLSRKFFAQPTAQKKQLERTLDCPWGFYDQELTKNVRDRKEVFDFSLQEDSRWPPEPAGIRQGLEDFASRCHRLSLQLLQLMGAGLGGAGNHLIAHFGSRHSSFTRLNYYPLPHQLVTDNAAAAGALGISQHTDAGGLTLLLQDGVSGLQVELAGHWHTIETVPDAFTVNVGDMMQVWSNDRYRSALHRVLGSQQRERFTVAYFLNPDYDCIVSPLPGDQGDAIKARYKPLPWREFRELRTLGDYGDYGEEIQITRYRLEE